MRNAEWAIITTRMIPKYNVRPAASSAYSPPSSTPRTRLWNSRATAGSPLRLGVLDGGFLEVVRQYDLDLPAHPLLDHVRALRPARGIRAQRAHHGVHGVRVQPVHQLALA